ncbi:hypothetical protein [Allomuricauda sp.]|nr:hypothetical protein [Allomuricauda sp.]
MSKCKDAAQPAAEESFMTLFIILIEDGMFRDILHNRIIAYKWMNS